MLARHVKTNNRAHQHGTLWILADVIQLDVDFGGVEPGIACLGRWRDKQGHGGVDVVSSRALHEGGGVVNHDGAEMC